MSGSGELGWQFPPIYFWDNGADQPVLSSMAPTPAAPPQAEPALQEKMNYSATLYTPANIQLPVMIENASGMARSEAPAVNDAGTLAANAGGDRLTIGPTNDPITLANESPELPFTDHPPFKFGPPLQVAAFVDDDSVLFTDSQRIFRADVQGGQAVVTTLVDNANEDTTLFNITLSGDKGTVALLSRQATTTTLYVLPVAGGAPPRPVHTFDELEVRILQFQ